MVGRGCFVCVHKICVNYMDVSVGRTLFSMFGTWIVVKMWDGVTSSGRKRVFCVCAQDMCVGYMNVSVGKTSFSMFGTWIVVKT